jgi:hypothetical protein
MSRKDKEEEEEEEEEKEEEKYLRRRIGMYKVCALPLAGAMLLHRKHLVKEED